MKCFITGGCGFIGSHLAEALVGQGHAVVIYDNLSTGHEYNLAGFRDRVTLVQGDIRDLADVQRAMAGAEIVFHEAAMVSVFESVQKPETNHEINVTGTLNVLRAARAVGARRALLATSAAVYGDDPRLPKTEDMPLRPESPYGLAKIVDEYYFQVFAKLYGLPTVCLRYFNVYGPRQDPSSMYSGVISKFADDLAKSRTPTIFGDGKQTRDFVFVKDVVQANLQAMNAAITEPGAAFNIATGRSVDLLTLLETMGRLRNVRVSPALQPARPGDVKHSSASIAKAQAQLGYAPQYSLEQGLRCLFEHRPPQTP